MMESFLHFIHMVFEDLEQTTNATMNSDDEDEKQLTEEEKKSHKFLHPLEV